MLKFNRKTAAGAVEVDVIYSTIGKQAQGINVKNSVILALGGICYSTNTEHSNLRELYVIECSDIRHSLKYYRNV